MKKIFQTFGYVTIAITMLFASFETFAQEYKGGILWNIQGNVKSVKYETGILKNAFNAGFTKEGKIKKSLMSYDDSGRPVGYGMNNDKTYIYTNIDYSPSGKPESIRSRNMLMSGEEVIITYKFAYDGELPSTMEMTDSENPSATITYSFSDYEFDANGNWIKRKVNVSKSEGDTAPKSTRTIEEVRKIKYYK